MLRHLLRYVLLTQGQALFRTLAYGITLLFAQNHAGAFSPVAPQELRDSSFKFVSPPSSDDFSLTSHRGDTKSPQSIAVMTDPLNGSTLGTRTGGSFVAGGGWQVVAPDNMIVYDLGRYVENGSLEVDVRNFDPRLQNTIERHHFLAMFRNPWGTHHPAEELETVWDLHAGTRYSDGVKLLSWTYQENESQTVLADSTWDADRTYHLQVIWEGTQLQYYRNGVLHATHIHSAPMQLRYIFLGRDLTVSGDLITSYKHNQYPAVVGPIYSNLAVKRITNGTDATPPIVSDVTPLTIYANAARIRWNTNEPSTCRVEYGSSNRYGNSTVVLGLPATTHETTLAGLAFNQTYHFRIIAQDDEGNTTVTKDYTFTTAAGGNYLFLPTADTFVEADDLYGPTRSYANFGWMHLLLSEGRECYFRFKVTGISESIVDAVLRLHGRQTGGGGAVSVLGSDWSESEVTWQTKPIVPGPTLRDLPPVRAGRWSEVSVLSALSGNGTYNFALTGSSSQVASLDSRESPSFQPELLIQVADENGAITLYGIHEITIPAENARSNPYLDGPAVSAIFTGTSGNARGKSITVKGFWDGDSTYRIRFAPTATGNWSWTTVSSDAGLNGKSGTLTCRGTLPPGHASARGHIHESTTYPYTFRHDDGTPFFLLGDTQWSFSTDAISWPTEFQAYVDARSAQGFNYIHGQIYPIFPPDNDRNEGGQAFDANDVDRLNPGYWQALDQRLAYLNQQGIVAGLLLAWANEGWQQFSTPAQVDRFLDYMINRYAAYNVIWITAGEYEEAEPPGGHNHVGEFLRANDPYSHPITTHTVNTSADDFGKAAWHTTIYQQINDPQQITIDRRFNKPVINAEFGYEGDQSAEEVRQKAWEIVMRGGFLVYGNTQTFHHDAIMTQENLYSEGAAFMANLKDFWDPADAATNSRDAIKWWRFTRFAALGNARWLAGRSGSEYVVYVDNPNAFTIDLSDAYGEIIGQWFDTRTGEWSATFSDTARAAFPLTPPGSGYAVYLKVATASLDFKLFPSYPNPLRLSGSWRRAKSPTAAGGNLVAKIAYQLPHQSYVKLVVYDLLGHELRMLVDTEQEAGLHEVEWDGRNEEGRLLPPGVYIYSMTAGNFRSSRKILLLKG